MKSFDRKIIKTNFFAVDAFVQSEKSFRSSEGRSTTKKDFRGNKNNLIPFSFITLKLFSNRAVLL